MNNPKNSSRWLALIAALLGWMFDGAEMGVFSLVGRQAVKDLLDFETMQTSIGKEAAEAQIGLYFNVIIASFLVGAATGGVVFGWLGDRIGRVRAMALSVLTYALFTGICGLVTDIWQLALFRFIASLGMGGEWALGVALVMEVWPNRSRALMAGLIGAAANVGYLLVAVVGLFLVTWLEQVGGMLDAIGLSESWRTALLKNDGWRIMMLLGVAPALLTFFIRLFVPESEKWIEEREKGTTSKFASSDLLGVLVGASGPALIIYLWSAPGMDWRIRLLGTLVGLVIATFGYTYPVQQFLKRQTSESERAQNQMIIRRMLLAAGLSGIALIGTWASTQQAASWADQLTKDPKVVEKTGQAIKGAKEWTLIALSLGAITGTILAALIGDWIGRKVTYILLCASSLVFAIALFQNPEYGTKFLVSAFLAGMCTASFYGWLPLYLPELFPTRVRAIGQGFGFNFGRILAAIGALQGGAVQKMFTEESYWMGLRFSPGWQGACTVMSFVYLFGIVLILFAPETKGKPLPQ